VTSDPAHTSVWSIGCSLRRNMASVGAAAGSILPAMQTPMAFTGQLLSCAAGICGRAGLMYDQCRSNLAPWSIHLLSKSISASVNARFLDAVGGIFSSGSSLVIRTISSLSNALPTEIADLIASSRKSNRKGDV